jgi:hypothetical protein
MKIAVCFSGMIRTGPDAADNLLKFVGDLDADYFLHTWDLDYQNLLAGQSWHDVYGNAKLPQLDVSKIEYLDDIFNFREKEISPYWATVSSVQKKYKQYLEHKHNTWWFPLFYSWRRSVELRQLYESKSGTTYDYSIKLRPDLIFHPNVRLSDLINGLNEKDFGVNELQINEHSKWADDIIFISRSAVMDKVSNFLENRIITGNYYRTQSHEDFVNYISNNGFQPVNLNLHYLSEDNVKISLLREECVEYKNMGEFEKCIECDRMVYHTLRSTGTKFLTNSDIMAIKARLESTKNYIPENFLK